MVNVYQCLKKNNNVTISGSNMLDVLHRDIKRLLLKRRTFKRTLYERTAVESGDSET